ncbi:MAG TPA: signal peptidase I [Candidatus Acidoferrales bacterium]|nr:signal peptidase I [Candidatus Acidoferrales bacterium]
MNPSVMAGFCRLYSMMLYAYPAGFRRDYAGPMKQLFRDRCRDVARTAGAFHILRFVSLVMTDWMRSALRERAAGFWNAGREQRRHSSVTEWAGTILIYLFATTTLVQAYVIPSGSMEGSLLVGDHVLVDRTAYADPGSLGRHIMPYRDVQHGDIIIFSYPEDVRETYVKRVIGVPGDRIRMEHGQVIRNGHRLVEAYTQHIAAYPDNYRDNFPQAPNASTMPRGRDMLEHYVVNGELVVPPGMLFALGDNRENSEDSRYWGFVPRSYVIGKPLAVYWSFDAPGEDLKEWSLGHVVDVTTHFFTRTRWNRMFTVPRSQNAEERP